MARFKNILGRREKVGIERITSDFVSLASHQLRTPLSAIKWNTEILLGQKHGRLNKNQLRYLQGVYHSNERAIALVNDLLDVSRIQEGSIHLDIRPTKVEKIIEEIIDNFDSQIRASKISVNFEISNGPLPKVQTDPEKLKHIIMNLFSNAIKYTLAEGQVKVVAKRFPRHLEISVTDSGIGISPADHAKVFGKFFRTQEAVKLAPNGTGLGLFIAKSLVEVMGGKIWFESQEGKGSTFFFTLPLAR